jgi:hypothetical protein
VGARKKARQWMEYVKTDAEKIGRTIKIIIKKTQNKQKKTIQGNTKADTKENQNKK